ncbi:hypothetical protein ColTof3_09376 [Colletotrichum tofieldiae]|nr:hypothetical protein ColTof3_09376 [Colletotrichum tofieldiae]
MYTPGYGFSNVPPNFNTGAPPPNQNPHMQPGSVPNQPGQQMMYNPNQFAGMPGGQSGFVGGPNPAMMSGAGPAGMMQNAGMPHMAANGQNTRLSWIHRITTTVTTGQRLARHDAAESFKLQ